MNKRKGTTRHRLKATVTSIGRPTFPAPLTVSRPELIANGSDYDFRRLVHNFSAFAARHEAVRAGHGARIGLTGVAYSTLIAVRHLEDIADVSVKLLAEHLHVSAPFATTMVGKLIKLGLLAKESDPEDRRKAQLHVTAKGHAALATLAPSQRRINDVQFGCLALSDLRYLVDILERLIECGDRAVALQAYLAVEHDQNSLAQ